MSGRKERWKAGDSRGIERWFAIGAENNNLTLITFITVKIKFNQGGCKWVEPE